MRFNQNTPRLQLVIDGQQVSTHRPMHQTVTKLLLDHAHRLGYKGTKLPAAGLPAIDVQGVSVWVDPLPEARAPGQRRRFALRVQSKCPQCGWVGAFGRFHQHSCK